MTSGRVPCAQHPFVGAITASRESPQNSAAEKDVALAAVNPT